MASRRSLRNAMVQVSIRLAVGGRESRNDPGAGEGLQGRGGT
jgi:hypothetical protein